jgi:hypothetical protein
VPHQPARHLQTEGAEPAGHEIRAGRIEGDPARCRRVCDAEAGDVALLAAQGDLIFVSRTAEFANERRQLAILERSRRQVDDAAPRARECSRAAVRASPPEGRLREGGAFVRGTATAPCVTTQSRGEE